MHTRHPRLSRRPLHTTFNATTSCILTIPRLLSHRSICRPLDCFLPSVRMLGAHGRACRVTVYQQYTQALKVTRPPCIVSLSLSLLIAVLLRLDSSTETAVIESRNCVVLSIIPLSVHRTRFQCTIHLMAIHLAPSARSSCSSLCSLFLHSFGLPLTTP